MKNKILPIFLSALLGLLPVSAQIPDKYGTDLPGRTRISGLATEGTYAVTDSVTGAEYNAVLVHLKEDPSRLFWFFEDAAGNNISKQDNLAELKTAAIVANLDTKTIDSYLFDDIQDSLTLLQKASLGIKAYDIGKFVVEAGSQIEGIIAKLVLTGDLSSAAASSARGLSEAVLTELIKEGIKNLSVEGIVIKSTVQMAATIKLILATYARTNINLAIEKLIEAGEILSQERESWQSREARLVYENWKFAMTRGIPSILLWNELADSAGLINTAKLIFTNFMEGLGVPFDKVFSAEETISLLATDEYLAGLIAEYSDCQSKLNSAFTFYEAIDLAPLYATLTVNTIPPDATVVRDGIIYLSKTPLTLTNIKAGIHHFQFLLKGYEPITKRIEIVSGEHQSVTINFNGATTGSGIPAGQTRFQGTLYKLGYSDLVEEFFAVSSGRELTRIYTERYGTVFNNNYSDTGSSNSFVTRAGIHIRLSGSAGAIRTNAITFYGPSKEKSMHMMATFDGGSLPFGLEPTDSYGECYRRIKEIIRQHPEFRFEETRNRFRQTIFELSNVVYKGIKLKISILIETDQKIDNITFVRQD